MYIQIWKADKKTATFLLRFIHIFMTFDGFIAVFYISASEGPIDIGDRDVSLTTTNIRCHPLQLAFIFKLSWIDRRLKDEITD